MSFSIKRYLQHIPTEFIFAIFLVDMCHKFPGKFKLNSEECDCVIDSFYCPHTKPFEILKMI